MINLDNPDVCKIKKTADLMHYEISIKCPMCGEWHTVTIKSEELFALRCSGTANVLTNLTPEEREMFISGTCPQCWKNIFGWSDDEDEEEEESDSDEGVDYNDPVAAEKFLKGWK